MVPKYVLAQTPQATQEQRPSSPENSGGSWKRLFGAMRNSLGCILDLPQECAKMRASHVAPLSTHMSRSAHSLSNRCRRLPRALSTRRSIPPSLPRLWASPERDCYQKWDPPLNLNRDSIFGSIKFTGQVRGRRRRPVVSRSGPVIEIS